MKVLKERKNKVFSISDFVFAQFVITRPLEDLLTVAIEVSPRDDLGRVYLSIYLPTGRLSAAH